MNDTVRVDDLPTSFGAFKPTGHVMVGLPSTEQAGSLTGGLRAAGWAEEAVLPFTPRENAAEMQALIDNASGLAGFGYELTLMRRYVQASREGCRWLLVKVDGTEQAATVAALAREQGAVMAVHYRALTVEDLI